MKKIPGLRRVRNLQGLSQVELGRRAGIRQPLVSELETGRLRPGPELRNRFARVLGMPAGILFDDGEEDE